MSGLKDATLRQLQILATAAGTLSFSRTSELLHVTQPAISQQMKQLEELAGLPLFDRVGRRLKLTQAGEELARHARGLLRALDDADDALAALRGLRGGRIRVAVTSTAKYFAPKLIALFMKRHPEVEVRLAVNNREVVIQLVSANEVDLAIMGKPPEQLDTTSVPFADHPLVVIAAPDHPLARRRAVPLEALARETFLVRERGSGTRGAMERFFAAHGVDIRIGMEMDSNETIKQAVMAGMGLSFISRHTIGLELAAEALAVVHAQGLPVTRSWNVVHLRSKRLSPAATAFEEFVLDEGKTFLRQWAKGGVAPASPGGRPLLPG
jgi:LysR family transcriptional regulator, low CO2-responsive transcriptional regulator